MDRFFERHLADMVALDDALQYMAGGTVEEFVGFVVGSAQEEVR